MRKNNNKGNVRTITTGHIEGDMLGQVIFWLSERKNRRMLKRHIEHIRELENLIYQRVYQSMVQSGHRVVSNGAYGVLTQYQRLFA